MAAENSDATKKTTTLGDFELKRKLGQGGMGVVYLGHQISLDRPCAVKVLSKEMAAKPGFVERFVREARSMAKIDHPHVVTCYAVGELKGYNYVAMELIDGRSMQDWVNQLGRIPVPDAILVTILCGEALHHAHEMNMVHRDVKPDNILVTAKGVPKVSDLGLAKAIDDEDLALTQSGTGLGTPHYMAPEQARNAKRVDRRCDVYALGCTLYYFVTGKTPFSGDSILELITNKEKGQFTPAKRLNPEASDRLSLMIDKAMASDPKARYATCAEFIADLESLGLANESLSFVDNPQKAVVRRRAGASASTQALGRTQPYTPPHSPLKPAAAPGAAVTASGAKLDGSWFVRHESAKGQSQVSKMSAPQVLQLLKSDQLNEKTQASLQAKGPFLPLSQIPVFEEEMRRLLARKKAHARETNLANQYEKLARQYERRKWWRYLGDLLSGAFGFVTLIIWLAIVAAVGLALYFAVPWVMSQLADKVGLGN